MARRLSYDEELISHIIPTTFNVGCRRPTPGSGYLEALASPKTKVYFETVHAITPHSLQRHPSPRTLAFSPPTPLSVLLPPIQVYQIHTLQCRTNLDPRDEA